MATRVLLPMLGQTMEEGTIIKWFKQEGEYVEKGEPLLEVMTDKVNMEVESPASGVVRKILAQPDETVPVHSLIAVIGTADEPIEEILAEAEPTGTPQKIVPQVAKPPVEAVIPESMSSEAGKVLISPRARRLAEQKNVPIEALAGRGTGPGGRITEKDVKAYLAETARTERILATPLAQKVAADRGIDIREVVGTGPQGRVTRDDVLQAATPIRAYPNLEARVVPLTGIRKAVADNVTRSAQTVPHVTLTTEVDMSETVRLREQVLAEFERKYGTRLSFTDILVKAVARAILDHPMVNSSLQGNEIRIFGEVNVGVAVALEGGLVVPVIRNADKKSLAEVSVELKRLVEKARSGNLSSEDMAGGTFTITNLGSYGVDAFNPIISPGQSAILGVCKITRKPVAIDDRVEIRSMMNLCLSFDHRVLDGAPAAQFLQRVKELLESPYQLLI